MRTALCRKQCLLWRAGALRMCAGKEWGRLRSCRGRKLRMRARLLGPRRRRARACWLREQRWLRRYLWLVGLRR